MERLKLVVYSDFYLGLKPMCEIRFVPARVSFSLLKARDFFLCLSSPKSFINVKENESWQLSICVSAYNLSLASIIHLKYLLGAILHKAHSIHCPRAKMPRCAMLIKHGLRYLTQ